MSYTDFFSCSKQALNFNEIFPMKHQWINDTHAYPYTNTYTQRFTEIFNSYKEILLPIIFVHYGITQKKELHRSWIKENIFASTCPLYFVAISVWKKHWCWLAWELNFISQIYWSSTTTMHNLRNECTLRMLAVLSSDISNSSFPPPKKSDKMAANKYGIIISGIHYT